jgi:hypothetical protein
MQFADGVEVGLQRRGQRLGQHGAAILAALAVAHQDFVAAEIEVLNAQVQRFEQPQARAVEELRDEAIGIVQFGQDAIHLVTRQDHWQPLWAGGPHHAGDAAGIDLEDFLVQEEDGTEGLVLGRGADVALDGQVRQEAVDLGRAHLQRVPIAVEEDEAAHPGNVGLLGAQAAMAQPNGGAQPIQEFRLLPALGRTGWRRDMRAKPTSRYRASRSAFW